jgi:myosin heavy subunit
MAKLLKPMVFVLLILSIASFVLGYMIFSEREIIKGRTQRLEQAAGDVASSLQHTDYDAAAVMDFERMDSALNALNAHAAVTWQDLMDTRQDLANTQLALEQTEAELADTQDQLQIANANINRLEGDLSERTAELAQANRDLDMARDDIAELEDDIEDLEVDIAELEEQNIELTDQVADQEALIEEYEAELFADVGTVTTPEGLSGSVMLVNRDWNFVILDIGRDQGLMLNTEMLVHRNEQLVGKVKISDLRPNVAIAEIMAGWSQMPLREGDHVLF